MNALCIALRVSNTSTQQILARLENISMLKPLDFNCFYHTSLLQFYTHLDLTSVKRLLTCTSHSSLFQQSSSDLRCLYPFPFNNVGISFSKYTDNHYAVMLNYGQKELLLQWARIFCELLGPVMFASGIDNTLTRVLAAESLSNESKFKFVYNFSSKVLCEEYDPHTTLGFVDHSDLSLVRTKVDSLFSSFNFSILHDSIVLAPLNHFCMTPWVNSHVLWNIV